MNTVIHNALIIPMSDTLPRYLRGDIRITDGILKQVGGTCTPEAGDKVVDGSLSIALPGLINSHTHLAMSLLRNLADDMDLFTWLQEHIWPREERLTHEDIRRGSYLGLAELIRSGVTTFADMYFYQQETADAVEASGIRAHIGATLMGDREATAQRMPELRELLVSRHNSAGGRIRVDIAPHAVYTCSGHTLTAARDLADEFGTMIHTHISESRQEQEDARREYGTTPVQYLDSLEFFSVPVYAAHGVFLSDRDLEICRSRDVRLVHCPTSNLKLANGTAPVAQFLEHGLAVGLGTDGASSNNNLNMIEEMHIASLIHKAAEEDPKAASAYEILSMATREGARVLGRDGEIGTLDEGKQADLILLDMDAPHLIPLNDPVSAVVYAAQASDVRGVMCAGTWIMEDRKLVTLDEERICAEAEESARRIR